MSRWLRWQYVVPRLLLCLVCALGAHFAIGLGVRQVATRSANQLLGTKVDVANARVSLRDGHVLLGRMSVADPCCPDECWFTADVCELELAARPLLARQANISKARMNGVRIDCAQAEVNSARAEKWFNDHAVEAARDRLAKLDDRFGEDLTSRLESVRRATELSSKWPEEVAALDARTIALERSAAELETLLDAISANHLRHDRSLDDAAAKVTELRNDLASLSADFDKLPQRLEEERRLIVAARRQDEQLVRGKMHVETIDAKLLNAYLIREQVAPELENLVGWLRRLRQVVPAEAASPIVAKRGEDVLFAGIRPTPNFLIRALEMQGEARLGNRSIEFRGVVSNLTTTPSMHGEPIQLRFSGTGSTPYEVRATIDRTGGRVRDELFVDCQEIALGEQSLGNSGSLLLQLAPSTASLTVSMSADGDRLSGDIQLVQKQVRITPAVTGVEHQSPIHELLGESIGKVGSLATRISLDGTIERPTCSLWSNLGPAVAEALEQGMKRHAEAHASAVLAEARRQVDERLAELERQLADHRERFTTATSSMTQRIDAIARAHACHERISVEQAGRRLPATSILR